MPTIFWYWSTAGSWMPAPTISSSLPAAYINKLCNPRWAMADSVDVAETTDPGRTPSAFWPAMRRLAGVFAPYKMLLILAVALTVVSVVLQVLAPLVLGEAVNVLFHSN